MKRYEHKKRMLIIWAAVLLMLTACGNGADAPAQRAANNLETEAPAALTEEATTEPEIMEPVINAPETLITMLEARGGSLQELAGLGCMQLVTVAVDGTEARIELYILENNQWQRQESLSRGGYVGKNGATDEKREGDKATPKGLYPIGEAFCIGELPQTGLSAFQITQDTYWVDDPASEFYNRRVEGTENKDWNSAEQMYRYSTSYEYGFVVGYNSEGTPNAGSAIFFHVGDHPTAGCITTDRAFVLQYLAALDEAKKPYILIN